MHVSFTLALPNNGSEERGILGDGSIPVAILRSFYSCINMNIVGY